MCLEGTQTHSHSAMWVHHQPTGGRRALLGRWIFKLWQNKTKRIAVGILLHRRWYNEQLIKRKKQIEKSLRWIKAEQNVFNFHAFHFLLQLSYLALIAWCSFEPLDILHSSSCCRRTPMPGLLSVRQKWCPFFNLFGPWEKRKRWLQARLEPDKEELILQYWR